MAENGLRERHKARTRAHIIDIAARQFAAKGFDNVTLEMVAAQCEVSVRTLLRYFPSDEAIASPPTATPLSDASGESPIGRLTSSPTAIVDNSSTHKTPSIQRRLLRHPGFTLHFTPTYSSWLNDVERWFAALTHQVAQAQRPPIRPRARRVNPNMDHQLERRPNPVVWHKTADEILDNCCQRVNDSGH